jgi:GNAT superfamily N-acetyltransferase
VNSIPMSIEEYHLLEQDPGLKVEYIDGCAIVSARNYPVTVTVPVARRYVDTTLKLRHPAQTDFDALVTAFAAAFHGTIDFYRKSEAEIQVRAGELLKKWFKQTPLEVLETSIIALDPEGADPQLIVGAALLIRYETGPHLDLLFVRPGCRRRGLGTAMVSAVNNALADRNEPRLSSFHDLGNLASEAWHRKFGFVEVPDLQAARLRSHAASHEVWRQERLGVLAPADLEELRRRAAVLQARVDELTEIQGRDGFESVAPILRFRPARD